MCRLWSLVSLPLVLSVTLCANAQPASVRGSTGSAATTGKKLATNVTVTFGGRSLRYALMQLAKKHSLQIFMDRRVDPDLKIDSFSTGPASLESILRELTRRANADIVVIGDLVYVGPKAKVHALPLFLNSRRDQVADLDENARRSWGQRSSMTWNRFATPAELVSQWSEQTGIRIVNSDKIPHDLWHENQLPAMSGLSRLTILLFGFNLAPTIENGQTKIYELPAEFVIEKTYPIRVSDAAMKQLQSSYPKAVFKRTPISLKVKAGPEVHAALADVLRSNKSGREVRSAERVFSLNIEKKPIGAVLQAIRQQTGMTIAVSEEAKAKLQDLVTFKVTDVNLDTLLRRTLQPVGLQFKKQGNSIQITSQ